MKRLLALVFSLLLPASLAQADGPGPQRKMTDAEAAAFNSLRAAVQEAMPKAPAGYTLAFNYISDFDEGMIPEAIKPGGMFTMAYKAIYTLDSGLGAQQAMAGYMERAKGTPEQQAKLAELDAKEAALSKSRSETRDPARKSEIKAELKAVRDEANELREKVMADYQAWVMSGGANAVAQDAQKSLPAKELSVWVRINDDVSLNDKAVPYAMTGVPLAFEQPEGCEGLGDCCITLFLGATTKVKKISTHTLYQVPTTDLGVATRARGIALTVTGPQDKRESVRDFARQIDLAKLKAVMP